MTGKRAGLGLAAAIALAVCLFAGWQLRAEPPIAPSADPFAAFTRAWRDDPVWHDGKAECAVYDAQRTIYGKTRHYQARLFTNVELADPQTKTKSATDRGREVFKHHLRQDIPTENYHYHYSTMIYVGTTDLKSLKLEMGSQEDCGASFKQYVNHAGECRWRQFSYFPAEGQREGMFQPPAEFAFAEALSLLLRGYPFEKPAAVELLLLADQTDNRWSSPQPRPVVVTFVGRETLDLPLGRVEAYHLRVAAADERDGDVRQYWFAADARPPWLHVMLRYEGLHGETMTLRALERKSYWSR